MAKIVTYQYCWLKVTGQPELEAWSGSPDASFGFWGQQLAAPGLFAFTSEPPSSLTSLNPERAVIAAAPCPTCPIKVTSLPPPPRALSAFADSTAWQAEADSKTAAEAAGTDDVPKVYFSLYPVGNDRDAAFAWITGSAGKQWVKNSLGVTLLSVAREIEDGTEASK